MASYKNFGEYLYNRLPDVYRAEDENQGLQLKKFLQVWDEGGFSVIQRELDNLPKLIDLDNCTDEQLDLVGSLVGISNDFGIPPYLLRRLLKVMVPIYKKKTTRSIIKYIAREVSGWQVDIEQADDAGVFMTFATDTPEEMRSKLFSEHQESPHRLFSYVTNRKTTFNIIFHAPDEVAETIVKRDAMEKILDFFRPITSVFQYVTAYYSEEPRYLITGTDVLGTTAVTDYQGVESKTIGSTEMLIDILTILAEIEASEFSITEEQLDAVIYATMYESKTLNVTGVYTDYITDLHGGEDKELSVADTGVDIIHIVEVFSDETWGTRWSVLNSGRTFGGTRNLILTPAHLSLDY